MQIKSLRTHGFKILLIAPQSNTLPLVFLFVTLVVLDDGGGDGGER